MQVQNIHKHGSISKVFGAGIRNSAGFKYSPNGRNTTFFANKKGVFTFVDYDVRKNKSSCPGGEAACVNDEFKETMPDFFFRKNKGTADLPSADGRHKFFATPFVMEARSQIQKVMRLVVFSHSFYQAL